MRLISRLLTFVAMVTIVIMSGTNVGYGQITPGQTAPVFSLKNVKGKTHDLSLIKDQPMIILYFFDAESRPSQEGLLSLDQLAKQYEDADLTAWGITCSSEDKVANFVAQSNPTSYQKADN